MSLAYRASEAILEHMLLGGRVSLLEAILLFGVQNPNAEFARIKKSGYLVKSQRVPMAKIIKRINKYTVCSVPEDLPYREIIMSEYWISR